MNRRQHPQSANAPEEKTQMPTTERFFVNGSCSIPAVPAGTMFSIYFPFGEGSMIFRVVKDVDVSLKQARVHRRACYGIGVPPGEPFTLTDAQLTAWKED